MRLSSIRLFKTRSAPRALLAFLLLGIPVCPRPTQAQGFESAVLVPTGNQPVAVYTADVNNDGIPDLIYIDAGATPTASTTHVLLGDGKGTFHQSAVLQTAGTSIALGNLLDGNTDIGWLSVNSSNVISLYVATNNGDGTFRTIAPARIAPNAVLPQPIGFSHLSTGRVQGPLQNPISLIAEDVGNQAIWAFKWLPDGSYAVGFGPLPVGLGQEAAVKLTTGPIDNLIVDGQTGLQAQIFAVNLPFGPVQGVTPASPAGFGGQTGVKSFAVADFNGDAKPDIAAEGASGRIDIFPGNGDGTFSSSSIGGTTSPDSSTGDGGQLIAAADLNNDGRPDLLTYNPPNSSAELGVSVELALASGNFSLFGVYPVPAGSHSSFATADFNRDGTLDLAMDTPGGIAILYGNAAPATPTATLTASPEPSLFEGTYTLTATIPQATAGTVTFAVDGTTLGTSTVQNGVAIYTVAALGTPPSGTPLLPGPHTLTGSYLASANATPQSLTGTHAVSLGPTSVILTPTTPLNTYFGDPVNGTFVVNVLDGRYPATGTWTNYDNGVAVPICTNLPLTLNGQPVDCPYGYPDLLNAGPHTFTIGYNGDPIDGPSISPPSPMSSNPTSPPRTA